MLGVALVGIVATRSGVIAAGVSGPSPDLSPAEVGNVIAFMRTLKKK